MKEANVAPEKEMEESKAQMSLVPSCDTLYFTPSPLDNLITLHWNQDSSSDGGPNGTAPFSFVVFKVKSSLPEVFRVVPCFGGLLLSDDRGEKPSGYRGGDVRISLLRPEILSTKPSIRFGIEYYVIQEESFTYNKLAESLPQVHEQTGVAKMTWNLVASGALQREHVSRVKSIPIYVKLGNDLESLNAGASARLVPPSSHGGSGGKGEVRSVSASERQRAQKESESTGERRSPGRGGVESPSGLRRRNRKENADGNDVPNAVDFPLFPEPEGEHVLSSSEKGPNGMREVRKPSLLHPFTSDKHHRSMSGINSSESDQTASNNEIGALRGLRAVARSMKLEIVRSAEKTKAAARDNREEKQNARNQAGSPIAATTTTDFGMGTLPGYVGTDTKEPQGVAQVSGSPSKDMSARGKVAAPSYSFREDNIESLDDIVMEFNSPFFFTKPNKIGTRSGSVKEKKKKKKKGFSSLPVLVVLMFLVYYFALCLRRWLV